MPIHFRFPGTSSSRPQEETPASNAPQPVPPHAVPLSTRLAGKPGAAGSRLGHQLAKRQITSSARMLALTSSRSSEMPDKKGLPAQLEGQQTLHANARELAQRVERIMDTTLEELPGLNARPGRSALMEKLSTYWPATLFVPKKLRDLVHDDAAYAQLGDASGQADSSDAATPQNTLNERKSLLAQVATGMKQLKQAESEYVAARDTVSAGGGQASQTEREALEQAERKLQDAVDRLHASVTLTTMLGGHDNALATDLLRRKTDFVKVQVQICQHKLRQAGLDLDQQRGLLIQQRDGLQETLAMLTLRADDARRGKAEMETLLGSLQEQLTLDLAQRPQSDAGAIEPPDAALEQRIAVATRQIDQLQLALPDVAVQLAAHEETLELAQQAFEQFAPVYHEKMTQLYASRRQVVDGQQQLSKSDDALSSRADAWKQRSADTYALELEQRGQAVEALLHAAPGFAQHDLLAPAGAQLQAALRQIADALPEDNPHTDRLLPRVAIVEIVSRACGVVAKGDVRRGAALLQELLSKPSGQWPGGAPSDDLRALYRHMAEVPRGMELLGKVAAGKTGAPPKPAQLEALQVYWIADQARAGKSPSDKNPWLDSAQSAAKEALRTRGAGEPAFDIDALPLEQKIAFRGVSKGLLSNGPGSDFERINNSLLKFGGEWVDLTHREEGKPLRRLPRSPFNPARTRTTPFDPKVLRLGIKQMEAHGMPSVKTDADKKIGELAGKLSDILAPRLQSAAPTEFDVMAKVLCDYISGQHALKEQRPELAAPRLKTAFHSAKRLYKSHLAPLDQEQIRRETSAQLRRRSHPEQAHAVNPRMLIKANPAAKPPPAPFAALFRDAGDEGVTSAAALRALVDHLDGSLSASEQAALLPELEKMEHAVKAAGRKRFQSKSEIRDFYAPMLEQLRLRNELTMTGGGEIGGGIPLLPWAPIAPLTANVNVNLFSKKQEAAFALKNPIYGMEFIMSDIVTTGSDIKGTVGFGLDLGPFKLTLPAFSLKAERSDARTDYTVLRNLRGKYTHNAAAERATGDQAMALLDTLINWDADDKQAPSGRAFQGPLEAVLALHPEIMVGWGSKHSSNKQASAELATVARAPIGSDRLAGGIGLTVTAKADGNTERTVEHSGWRAHETTVERVSQRRQRLTGGLTLGGTTTLYKHPLEHAGQKEGSIRVPGVVNLLDSSVQLAYNLERNRYAVGDKQGATLDRIYARSDTILAEIENNMEDFYLRFLEAVPVEPGEARDTPQNRLRAETSLRQFMADVKAAKSSPSLQFNLRYELQPRVAGWLDSLNALEKIALQGGDQAAARRHREASEELLQFRSSWTFKNCTIRSSGKSSDDRGWDLLIRLMSRRSAESSVTPTAYPG
ncbi:hypothetical protein [Janthinobacterium agaricidamnosum]|uniref:Uncharacterized protein n=1 Tax=Janthinobacterium agaricidamnosum NBRC 102515 = DSM 9628 TaxID=1349767 RepID=W0V0G1_9BURK|nr:hypothetical protein [Janthinobacterium agaricidamnosum]CDG82319.1 hypothetical protein GJA_1681 [Janthinobacterium agaricidamnosum NBRC 102515 = DSM 9628]